MIKKSFIAFNTIMVSSIIVVLVIYCQSPLHSNSNKELNFMPPKKDSLQLLIDNFEKIIGEKHKFNYNQSKVGKILTGLGYNKVKTNGIFN